MQKWEREQIAIRELTINRDRTQRASLKFTDAQLRKGASKRKHISRIWTEAQTAQVMAAIESGQTVASLAKQLGMPYASAWQKHTELLHQLKRSRPHASTNAGISAASMS